MEKEGELERAKIPKRDDTKEESDELILTSLAGFEDVKLMRQNGKKVAFFQATIAGRGKAVVIMEKSPFSDETVEQLISSSTSLKPRMANAEYRQYDAFPDSQLNPISTTVIYPPSEKILAKLKSPEMNLVRETPKVYETVTREYIKNASRDLKWVYNILDHTSEQDRVRFEDKDPQTGFILVLDLKWDEKTVETLYLLGICHVPGITCLRDLGEQHLPLLKNMLSKGRAAISEHYGLPARQIKVYVHYQPSFYHFHVHYVHILLDDPGGVVGHAHLLEDVIDNIEHISPRYYQDCTLTYSLRKEDMLWKEMEKTGQLTDY